MINEEQYWFVFTGNELRELLYILEHMEDYNISELWKGVFQDAYYLFSKVNMTYGIFICKPLKIGLAMLMCVRMEELYKVGDLIPNDCPTKSLYEKFLYFQEKIVYSYSN